MNPVNRTGHPTSGTQVRVRTAKTSDTVFWEFEGADSDKSSLKLGELVGPH